MLLSGFTDDRKTCAYTITTDTQRQTDVRLVRVSGGHFAGSRWESIDNSSSNGQASDAACGRGTPDATHGPAEASDLAIEGQEGQEWQTMVRVLTDYRQEINA